MKKLDEVQLVDGIPGKLYPRKFESFEMGGSETLPCCLEN